MDIKGLFTEALLLQEGEKIVLNCQTEQMLNSLRQRLIRERTLLGKDIPELASSVTISCIRKPAPVIELRHVSEPITVTRYNKHGGVESSSILDRSEEEVETRYGEVEVEVEAEVEVEGEREEEKN